MEDDLDRLAKLEKKLYSRTAKKLSAQEDDVLLHKEYEVPPQWSRSEQQETVPHPHLVKQPSRTLKIILAAAITFFVLATAFAVFIFLKGDNTISNQNVNVLVSGPGSVQSGDTLSLQVVITNNNSATMQLVDLAAEYPPGTKSNQDRTVDLPRSRQTIGDIAPGSSVSQTLQAILFGQEGGEQQIKLAVEYRLAGSNAVFEKDTSYRVKISAAPVQLSVDAPQQISAGQQVQIEVTVASKTNSPVSGVVLAADYPFGFSFGRASPAPSSGNNLWRLGDLAPGTSQTITISGSIQGEDQEQRGFHFSVGEEGNTAGTLATTYASVFQQLVIEKPFITLDLSLNNTTDSTLNLNSSSQDIEGRLSWQNNLASDLADVQLRLNLSGNAIDRGSVLTDQGFYDSSQNMIVWSKQNVPQLAVVKPGDGGTFTFRFSPLALGNPQQFIRNPEIDLGLTASGTNVSNASAPSSVSASINRIVRFSSSLAVNAISTYGTGPFQNKGPIPPQAEQPTTYSVALAVSNTGDDISNAAVTFTVPQYVTWLKNFTPGNEPLSFDPDTSTLTWRPGSIPSGTGVISSPRQVTLQLQLLPSLSQVDQTPSLLTGGQITAHDDFTGQPVSATIQSPTTAIQDSHSFSDSKVTR